MPLETEVIAEVTLKQAPQMILRQLLFFLKYGRSINVFFKGKHQLILNVNVKHKLKLGLRSQSLPSLHIKKESSVQDNRGVFLAAETGNSLESDSTMSFSLQSRGLTNLRGRQWAEATNSIGALTAWGLGGGVRSRLEHERISHYKPVPSAPGSAEQ